MARTFGRCLGCGDPLDSPDFRTCGRCAVLLEGMEDLLVEPPPQPAREPGDDDLKPKPKHVRDARWLYAAVRKRGKVREAQAIGRRLRLHSNMLSWSVDQVDQVVAALVAAKTPR